MSLRCRGAVLLAVLLAHAGLALWLCRAGLVTKPSAPAPLIMAEVLLAPAAPPAVSVPVHKAVARPVPATKIAPKPVPKPPTKAIKDEPSPSVLDQAARTEPVPSAPSPAPEQAVASAAAAVPERVALPTPAPEPITLPSSSAEYLNNPPPPYPRISRQLGEQGKVVVRVLISARGRAEQAEIRQSSGYARLDEVALETVKGWSYVPGKRAGVPETMWFNVPLHFVLH